MTDQAALKNLEERLENALGELDRLTSLEAIRDCVYRVSRGTDRVDEAVLRSAFHPDAVVHFGKIYDGPVDGWINSTLKHQAAQSQRQHLVGNILVRLDGNTATAESYCMDRHKTPMNGQTLDMVIAARALDRLERRDGTWRIVERTKVMDWGRVISADDGLYHNSPLAQGGDDRADPSYDLLP
jgi:hypothetical protein